MSTLTRIQQTTRITLTTYLRPDGVLTDATGDLTATLKRLDGTTVDTATATRIDVGTYTYTVPEQPDPDYLTLDWTGTLSGAAVSLRDYVEIVGGFYFGLSQARDEYRELRDTAKWPNVRLAQKRVEVEQECDTITGQAWVPRFGRYLLDGTGTDELVAPDVMLRTVRAVSVADRAGGTFVALSAAELAATAALDSGVLVRGDGTPWPAGRRNVLVEVEHGADLPPAEISTAAMARLAAKLAQPSSAIPPRAVSWTLGQGGVFRISTPNARMTGMPDVDAVYQRQPFWGRHKTWLAS